MCFFLLYLIRKIRSNCYETKFSKLVGKFDMFLIFQNTFRPLDTAKHFNIRLKRITELSDNNKTKISIIFQKLKIKF